jgi:hypothetical protein
MEDVDALKTRFKEESYLFVVDSAKRDKYAYASPSEYTIQFNAPFKNVLGIELLDASIPRTEYVVDEPTNTLTYSTTSTAKTTVTVPPGDYNLLQFCDVLSSLLGGTLAVEPVSAPYAQTSTLKFTCSEPFTLHLSESTMRRHLGFSGTEKTIQGELSATATTTRSFLGPFPGYDIFRVEPGTVLRQAFQPTVSGSVHSVVVHIDTETSGAVDVSIRDGDGSVYGTAVISAHGSSTVTLENVSGELTAGLTYYIIFESTEGADVYVNLGTDTTPTADEATSTAGPWTPLSSGNSVACEVWTNVGKYEAESTGLVDLTGVRYVMVRCPEIETYLYRERAYEPYYAGLGMVKLGGNGMREQRFDFVSFPARTLTTPLGKLSSLTFKLEKPDGTIYNSRGIDHTLLLVIRYYAGVKGESTQEQHRILNPHYIPNPIEYLERTRWHQETDARDTLDAWPRHSR